MLICFWDFKIVMINKIETVRKIGFQSRKHASRSAAAKIILLIFRLMHEATHYRNYRKLN